MVEPAFLALTTTPSMAPSRSDAILPLSAVSGDCAAAVPAAINSQASKPVPQTRAPIIDPRIWIRPYGSTVAPGWALSLSLGRHCAESRFLVSPVLGSGELVLSNWVLSISHCKRPISGKPRDRPFRMTIGSGAESAKRRSSRANADGAGATSRNGRLHKTRYGHHLDLRRMARACKPVRHGSAIRQDQARIYDDSRELFEP